MSLEHGFPARLAAGPYIGLLYPMIQSSTITNASMPAKTSVTNTATTIIGFNHSPRILLPRSTSLGRAGIATHRTKRTEKTTAGIKNSMAN